MLYCLSLVFAIAIIAIFLVSDDDGDVMEGINNGTMGPVESSQKVGRAPVLGMACS
jgi:hypothetical protein